MPVDAHELSDLRAGHEFGQPGDLQVKLLGKARVWEGPGHRFGNDAVSGTVNASRGVPKIDQNAAEIERPPLARCVADTVVARATGTAVRASLLQPLVGIQVKVDADYSIALTDFKAMNIGEIFDMEKICK